MCNCPDGLLIAEAGYLRQPLHSSLMLAEQIRDLVIQLIHLLFE